MIIYIDENMSEYLAEGLDLLQKPLNQKLRDQIEVKSIKKIFGQGAKDEDWIPIAGEQGACVITQDYNIKKTRHQRELYEQFELGIFFLIPPSKKGFSYWDMVKLLTKHWEGITNKALTESRPFAYKVSSRGRLENI